MQNIWEDDRQYLERKFTDPAFYADAPGTPLSDILDELAVLAEKERDLPHPIAKARALELLLQKVPIAVSSNDYFPGFDFYLKRSLDKSYHTPWKQNVQDRIFTPEDVEELNLCNKVHLGSVRFDFEHSVPDWDAVLELGFSGLLERIKEFQNKFQASSEAGGDADVYFDSLIIAYNAVLKMLDRLIAEAARLPAQPKGAQILQALQNLHQRQQFIGLSVLHRVKRHQKLQIARYSIKVYG